NSVGAFAGYVSTIGAAGPGDIVKLTGNEVLTSNETITALLLAAGASVGQSGFTLTIGSGGLLAATGTNTIIGGTLAFGAAEGIVMTNNGATTVLNSPITGTSGVTIGSPNGTAVGSGAGTLILPNPNSYTGGTTLSGGVLSIGSGAALGGGTLTLL